MKKTIGLALCFILCLSLLTGCGKKYNTERSTLFINKNGSVVCTDVEKFDESIYSLSDLEGFIDDAISAYNEEFGKKSIKKKSVKVEDGSCTSIIKYASYEDYARFNGLNLFYGTVAEALASGYAFDKDFAAVDGETASPASAREFLDETDYKVVILDAPYDVNVFGKLKFVSVGHVSITGKSSAYINWDAFLKGVEVEENTEGVEGTEIEDDTQTDSASNGSVDEDEMAMDEEEEISFDFPEEEEIDHSFGTIYIIFK